jgi:TPR repeat protein
MNGWGLPRDRCSATEWYGRAARAGEASAQFWLAMAYLPPNGQGVKPDKLRAFQWASAAAAQGQPTAKQLFFFFTRDLSPDERRAAEASLEGWSAAAAPAPEIRRYPYVPLLVGIWPRLTDDVIPCRQDEVPLEQWPGE